ncbi:hypothetical protein T12_13206, partial [Trichinella patagoniensis]
MNPETMLTAHHTPSHHLFYKSVNLSRSYEYLKNMHESDADTIMRYIIQLNVKLNDRIQKSK